MGKKKVENFFVIFCYLHFTRIFGGNNPHYPISETKKNKCNELVGLGRKCYRILALRISLILIKNIIKNRLTKDLDYLMKMKILEK